MFQRVRIWKHAFLSSCEQIEGKPLKHQPVELSGKGRIIFRNHVRLGVYPSPYFFTGSIYIEARNPYSIIEIDDGVWINNNAVMISEGNGIFIGKKTLIGLNVEIYDSDFHGVEPNKRSVSSAKMASVCIGENVFIGSNVKILKGVSIGNNSIIGAGSIVTQFIPSNVVAAGVPAKVIRQL